MARITLRLPDDLHDELVLQSRGDGKSLNQLIVESLQRTAALAARSSVAEHERFAASLRDLLVPVDEIALPEPDDAPPNTASEELQPRLPTLNPPLSQSLIDGRVDRI